MKSKKKARLNRLLSVTVITKTSNESTNKKGKEKTIGKDDRKNRPTKKISFSLYRFEMDDPLKISFPEKETKKSSIQPDDNKQTRILKRINGFYSYVKSKENQRICCLLFVQWAVVLLLL